MPMQLRCLGCSAVKPFDEYEGEDRCEACGSPYVGQLERTPLPNRAQPRRRDSGTPGVSGEREALTPRSVEPPAGASPLGATRGQVHTVCAAHGCEEPTPRARLLCRDHWHVLSAGVRVAVLSAVVPESEAEPPAWHAAAFRALAQVALDESRLELAQRYAQFAGYWAEICKRESADGL